VSGSRVRADQGLFHPWGQWSGRIAQCPISNSSNVISRYLRRRGRGVWWHWGVSVVGLYAADAQHAST